MQRGQTYAGDATTNIKGVVSGINDLVDMMSHEEVSSMDERVVGSIKEGCVWLIVNRRSAFTSTLLDNYVDIETKAA